MPRRKPDEAVAERASQLLAEKGQRRREGAEKAAQTRRRGRGSAEAEAQEQAQPKRATRAKGARKERKPRVHQDLITVAYRGPLAGKFREMAERHQMSLARLLQDAMLTYERSIAAGYQPGATLEEWKAQHGGDEATA